MTPLFGVCLPWLLMVTAVASAQKNFNQRTGLATECLGNVLRVTLDKSLTIGNHLEIDAMNGSQIVPLTPGLAAKCGYSMESDPWGNTKVYASLLNCFADNQEDGVFDLGMQFRMYGDHKSEEDKRVVTKTCRYNQWAPREILCDRNYIEVSIFRLTPDIEKVPGLPEGPDHGGKMEDDQWASAVDEATGSEYNIWRMVFFTPKEKAMLLDDALKAGYGISATATRLVLRSPYNTPETYTENVHGVPMEVFRATTYFKGSWSVAMLDTAAACPTGGLVFTDELIRWYMPQHITPLSLNVPEILEVYMGIDGKRLDAEGMASKGYVLSMQDSQILMEIPIGGPDGYYKSHALDYQYHITYTIEPMLEMLWREGDLDLTRYKVLFPITTPPMPRPPHVIDQTVPELRMFDVLLGTFLFDVELANITFSTGVLTVAEANAQGISVQENRLSNGSKTFTLQVPFSDPVVLKHNPSPEVTTYTLPLLYGLMVLPEQTPFPHPALVEATVQDIVLPTVTGICDQERFYVTVEYGNRGSNFKTYVGQRELSPEVAEEYGFYENSTHMRLAVSYLASDVVFELVQPSSVRGRLDLYLFDPTNNWILRDFSLACPFPMTMTECLSNGTMTALAVKVESVPQLVPSQLTLKDPSCRPTFSNDRFAYFTFDLTSCGTTRAFFDGVVMYQNEISEGSGHAVKRPGAQKGVSRTSPLEPEYRLTVSCYYLLNDTETIAFVPRPMSNEPIADVGFGELQVWMRLAKDMSYDVFYTEQEFPVVQHLRRPLYFEVELRQSIDPRMEIVLENCWATLHEDRASTPRWDLIVDGCENSADQYLTALVSVTPDTRVQYPTHYKRFEVKMFTFVRDERVLTDQIFVHCDAVLCDSGKETAGVCSKRCASQPGRNSIKGRRSATHTDYGRRKQMSTGKILLLRT